MARLEGGPHDGRKLPIDFLSVELRLPDGDEPSGRYVLPRRGWNDGAFYVYVWQEAVRDAGPKQDA